MYQLKTATAWSAKSARPRRLALLGTLAALVAGALTGCAPADPADFSLSASPATQTVVAGKTATLNVQLARQNGHSGAVTLDASGLPAGAKASFLPRVLRSSASGSKLSITTAVTTAPGAYTVTVTGGDGKLARTATVTLAVQAAQAFKLSLSPAARTLPQGDATSYAVRLTRLNGFSGAVALTASGLPSGASAKLTPSTIPASSTAATLDVTTTRQVNTGTSTITVTGTASGQSQTASATLKIEATKDFLIAGNALGALAPGASVPVALTVSNPHNFAIKITGLTVSVEAATSHPGCTGTADYAVTQVPASAYPITVAAGATRSLADLIGSAALPTVTMLDRPTNQDACKGASLTLDYAGTATK